VNPAATWERLVLMDALSRLTLSNTGNQCFVNAAVMATLWAILSRVDFQFSDLGPEATLIASSIMSFSLGPLTLADQTWFQDVLHSWPNPTNQGDPVEFLSHVLRGMHFGGFNMKWERRMQINEIIRVMDHNDALRPITVQFDELDPDAIQHGYTALQTMINSWESQYGMQTALTDPTALVCIHVDRFVHQGKSSVTKSERPIHFRGSLTLPVFDNTGLTISRRGYQLLSAIAHLGADEEGHCRAILKTWPQAAPNQVNFLVTDDGQPPQRIWEEPMWFKQNLTCFLFCDCDSLDLFRMPALPDPAPETPTTDSPSPADPELNTLQSLIRAMPK